MWCHPLNKLTDLQSLNDPWEPRLQPHSLKKIKPLLRHIGDLGHDMVIFLIQILQWLA